MAVLTRWLNPVHWSQRMRFAAGLSAIAVVVLFISAIRGSSTEPPHPGIIITQIEEGRYEDALVALSALEQISGDQITDANAAWVEGERGFIYLQQGDYDKGLGALDRAISLDATQAGAYVSRALTFQRLGRNEAAEADFTMAIQLEPNNYSRYRERSVFYFDNGDDEHALVDATSAVNLGPDQPFAFTLRADIYSRMGRYESAVSDLDRVIELAPGQWGPYVSRALAKNQLNDNAGALADLDAALALGPPPEGRTLIDSTRLAFLSGDANGG